MALLDVSAIPRVALDFQNEDHDEEAHLVNEVAAALARFRAGEASREDVLLPLDALVAHTRAHFEREDDAMRRWGFPALPVHTAEHAHVLAQMEEEARAFVHTGDAERLWRYVTGALPSWFVNHIQTMDTVTGSFVQMRGG
jgi:hemerythrin